MAAVGPLLVRVAGVLYVNWLLQLVLPVTTSPGEAPVSALSVDGQPFAWLFRSLDASSGTLLVVGCALVLLGGVRRVPRGALVAAALVGATNVALALVPEECGEPGAPGPTCSDQRLLSDPHTALSLVQDLSAAAVAAVLLVSAWRHRRLGRAVLPAVVLVAWTVSWLTGGGAFLGGPVVGSGWFQRAFVTTTAVLLVVMVTPRRRQEEA